MKKFIVTFLAVFYLGASSGATVHMHYCMGKLVDWGISDNETDDCSNCGMEKGNSEDCCKDKEHKLTIKDSPKAFSNVYLFECPGVAIPLAVYNESLATSNKRLESVTVIRDSPPRTRATLAFIRNCNFRI